MARNAELVPISQGTEVTIVTENVFPHNSKDFQVSAWTITQSYHRLSETIVIKKKKTPPPVSIVLSSIVTEYIAFPYFTRTASETLYGNQSNYAVL